MTRSLVPAWAGIGTVIDTVRQDARYALRLIRQHPGFSTLAVLTLALGIGGTTVAFSVIDAAMLRPLPYAHPEQLVEVKVESTHEFFKNVTPLTPSSRDLELLQAAGDVFSHLAKNGGAGERIVEGPSPVRVSSYHTQSVTEQYFDMLGVKPIAGRLFTRDDMVSGAPDVVILSYGYWQREFGGDADVVGRTMPFRSGAATIVGILPAQFFERGGTFDRHLWFPLRMSAADALERGQGKATARLRPGITPEEAERRLTRFQRQLSPDPRGPTEGQIRLASVAVAAARDEVNHPTVNGLIGALALVFLLACVNVAGLTLARGVTRRPELAVRASLGAGRARIVRQLLTETIVLWTIGALAGLVVASIAIELLVANVGELTLPTNAYPRLNVRALMATAIFTVVTGVLSGLIPALRLSDRRQRMASLSPRGGQWLVAGEIALAVTLLAGAALMAQSFLRLTSVDPGFDTNAIVMDIAPLDDRPAASRAYYLTLIDKLRSLPEVAAVGAGRSLRLDAGQISVGESADDNRSLLSRIRPRSISPGYFEALRIPLRQGRLPADADLSGVSGVWLSESAARELFPDGGAVGRVVQVSKATRPIVGIVADVNYTAPYGSAQPEIYLPDIRLPEDGPTLVIRARGEARGLLRRLREAAHAAGPATVDRLQPARDAIRSSEPLVLGGRWTGLFGVFGGVGTLLGLVGVFGMTAYSVARRTREIGVRIAIGARPQAVVAMLLRDAAWPIAGGIVAGLGVSALTTRVIESLLFNTTPTDPGALAFVVAALGVTAGTAAWIPARRAAVVDPVRALRAE